MSKIVFLLVALFYLLSPSIVSAHLAGQPPFFKIDGKYSNLYNVQSLSTYSPEFQLPQDIAPEHYYVGQSINFEIDTQQLQFVVPQEIIEKTKFIWDFGDGLKSEGLENQHQYKKMGSYILTIQADTSAFERGVPPQTLQSVLLQILPDMNYQLPKATIRVNGREEYRDPKTNTIENVFEVNLKNKIKFEVVGIPQSRVTSYFWDLGDGETSKESVVDHEYKNAPEFVLPAVRVKTEDGFIIDTSVGLKHNPSLSSNQVKIGDTSNEANNGISLIYLLVGVITVILLIALAIFKVRNKN